MTRRPPRSHFLGLFGVLTLPGIRFGEPRRPRERRGTEGVDGRGLPHNPEFLEHGGLLERSFCCCGILRLSVSDNLPEARLGFALRQVCASGYKLARFTRNVIRRFAVP